MVETRRAGRPRDPELEHRAHQAARAVYAERGWSGYTLDEVARRSGIGKGSLYLRWSSKEELLVEAVRARIRFIADIDTGDLRSDLIEFATSWMAHESTDDGSLARQLSADAHRVAKLREAFAGDPYPEHLRATRAIIRRGIERAELPPKTSVALVADLIAGAVSNHVTVTPPHLRERASAESAGYIVALVDTIIAGVRATADDREQRHMEAERTGPR
ncbi:TetR/AcrR family transcriptional regulator [Nocardia cyriacigeorgica]|uniref:TetR/AcrR family transcriptional regulator n=1 Tax=Nocardia cyriacigeorgica TaxID=135487 RepID=UPI001893D8F5|nr:TetR/AcrR family transcriptional regulator [Nocardia cyriacigeorgica]MBF6082171.1 TetR/AcrR family transcriptional regulator [Nocardia cyriacigeorgica]